MGGRLTDREASEIEQSVLGGQVERGNFMGNAATMQRVKTIAGAADTKRAQAQQDALQFLVSGVAPEDVAYRDRQQDEANLGAFMNGETPTAQFGQLSGAQNQAAPFITGGFGTGTNPNAGQQAAQFNYQNWQAQNNFAQGQVNPWVTGLNMGIQATNTAAAFGAFRSPNVVNNTQTGWYGGMQGLDAGTGYSGTANVAGVV